MSIQFNCLRLGSGKSVQHPTLTLALILSQAVILRQDKTSFRRSKTKDIASVSGTSFPESRTSRICRPTALFLDISVLKRSPEDIVFSVGINSLQIRAERVPLPLPGHPVIKSLSGRIAWPAGFFKAYFHVPILSLHSF